MKTVFISDMHLCENTPGLNAIFLRFLGSLSPTVIGALYILGDMFEAHPGDDFDAPFLADIEAGLRAVSTAEIPIYFVAGNRDFLVGDAFAIRTGMTLLEDPFVTHVGGQRTVLSHGDRYCTEDIQYVKWRALSRNPAWQRDFLAQPLGQRKEIARAMRAESMAKHQAAIAIGASDLGDVVSADVASELERERARRLIHGHTHRPGAYEVRLSDGTTAERIVLADWREAGEVLVIEHDGTAYRQTLT